ncbi:MAG: hypothetical protein HYT75_01210 [Deltaproteobacteria bacterium]|nr:hypothetical protein [Deltaproteobacteria bacterium]
MSALILVGAIWGFLEATLGGFLHSLQSPVTGAIMMPIGFGLLHLGFKNGLQSSHIFYASLIAASFKFIDPLLFSMPFFHIRVLDPAAAIIMQGSVYAITASLFSRICFTPPSPLVGEGWGEGKQAIFSLLIVLSSTFLFNLFSLAIFGQGMEILSANILISVVLTAFLISAAEKSCDIRFISPAWRFAAASALFTLTILTRIFLA